jgi:RHS repeat-associated protein
MHTTLKKLLTAAVLLLSINAAAQTPVAPPAAYAPTIKVNYVREYSTTAPITDATLIPTRPVEEVKTTTAYLDGLGRPLQSVSKQNSPLKKDLVSATVYDALGRETYKYLPFTSTTTTAGGELTDNGGFKLNPFQQQASFYDNANTTSPIKGQGETFFYGQTDFEASPLNRPVKSFAPGNSWAGSRATASEKAVQQQYQYNTTADVIPIFSIAAAAGSMPTSSGNYAAGQLYKNIMIDERGNKVTEFINKEGNVILKKVQAAATVTDGFTGWLSTHYVYDDFNQLRLVLPPKATEAYIGGMAISTIASELCFRYEYDSRHRLTIKKLPGAGEIWMVYDSRDRMVMMQDANLRTAGKWMVTVYDGLNRTTQTGLLTDAATSFATHQTNANASSAYPSTAANFELLSQNYYDDYTWVAGTGTTLTATIDAANTANPAYFITTYNTTPYFALPITANYTIKGMPTGSKIKVLGTASQYLYSVVFYDEKGRMIQTQNINITGGKDINTLQYDFSGKPLRTLTQQSKAGTNAQINTLLTKIEYDHQKRLLAVRKTATTVIGATTIAPGEKIILQNSYDELGQLKTKKLGTNPLNTLVELESLAYDYNIRGWLLGINRDYMRNPVGDVNYTNRYFGFELGYDKTTTTATGGSFTAAQFNGNIAGMVWKGKGDAVNRKYDFTYDNVNRLLQGNFKQDNGAYGSTWNNTTANFSISMGNGTDYTTAYDANGNIKQMQQWGLKLNTSALIDNLSYNYTANSNKLLNVIDAANDNTTKLGDFRTSALSPNQTKTATTVDYTYDANGNLKKDLNKDIGTAALEDMVYNHLNLPQSITVRTTAGAVKGTIVYTYDAAGSKLKKVTTEGAKITTTLYLGGAVYQNDTLQFIAHEEGRIRFKPTNNTLQFDYMIKDHLGNTRVVLTEEQQPNMYPAATMEVATIAAESNYYGNLTNTTFAKPAFFSDPLFTTNAKVAQVKNTTTTQKIGPNIILKVMAGDSYNIRVASGWSSATAATNSSTNVLSSLLSLLSTGVAGNSNGKASAAGLQNTTSGLNTGLTSFLATQTTTGTKPKAYINWLVLDEQFKIVPGSSGFEQVGASGVTTIHVKSNLTITKNGYLYIYTSNEATNVDVFFDNFQVTHTRGQILEETSYYPFGLTMAGISSKSAAGIENRYKFNSGTELNNDFDINIYETYFRNLDPQIGRFWQIDPLFEIEYNQSPFAYADNNPIIFNDPLGLAPEDTKVSVVPKPHRPLTVYVPGKIVIKITPPTPTIIPPAPTPTPNPTSTPSSKPIDAGDRLCPRSFNFKQGNENSFYSTDMMNLRFEAGEYANNFNASYNLTNGISDNAMNKVVKDDILKQGLTPLQYLKDVFKDLFDNGDISSKVDNGIVIWNFNKYAAQHIAAWSSNLASLFTLTNIGPTAAVPKNALAWSLFANKASSILRSFMPGSAVSLYSLGKTNISIAEYSKMCSKK